jgi:hypothetical protein
MRPGSPIRTPSDHSSFDSSPRPFAAYHVLHRLLVPRHPPCALKNLATKMLASTVQISNTHRHTIQTLDAPDNPRGSGIRPLNSPALKKTTAGPPSEPAPLFPQDPTVCDRCSCDVPPLSAGTTTNGWSTGQLCDASTRGTTADPPDAGSKASRGSLERR